MTERVGLSGNHKKRVLAKVGSQTDRIKENVSFAKIRFYFIVSN